MGGAAQDEFIDRDFGWASWRRNLLRRYKDRAAVLRIGNRGL